MKYFDSFAGIGGFAQGIIQAHENCRMARKRKRDSGSQGRQEAVNGERMGNTQANGNLHLLNSCEKPSCVGFSEIDKYAIQTYQHNFPNHKNYGDITKIDPEELPDFDCFVGGVPCTTWSIAGKREGFNDPRGNLWFESVRILKAKQPPLFVLENVKGLLSHDKGNSMERICEELCAVGYAIDFDILNSKNFGVPQNRERLFIIGKRIDTLSEMDII